MSTSFRKRDTCSIRELAQFIGTLTAACPAVKYGWLYTKRLEQLNSTHPLANRLTLVAAKLSGRGFN
ncbi:unnamed protein product [Acanthoscelides obtectus]|uniref:Uncharacterized protein n=1 Tax=Acanthoscelides obtectus TaxID=200917 RepID=A0A9P0PTV1_ACAOB|nr:unnamed protein product [Acanthoscelides obtectus]CAK1683251.1 hypothetical protein AOBTE_LOCUS34167 [Acanthoscelides obtectus]